MSGFLGEAADLVADTLAEALADLGITVYRVTTPGYAQLSPPCVAVDAPTIDDWSGYLKSQPRASVSVPIRVLPKTSDAGAELIALADATLSALHDSGYAQISTATPAVAVAGQGITAPLPTYRITVSMNLEGN